MRSHLRFEQIKDLGATGRISFQDTGRRTGYVVNVYGLGNNGLYEVTKQLLHEQNKSTILFHDHNHEYSSRIVSKSVRWLVQPLKLQILYPTAIPQHLYSKFKE